MKKYFVSKGSDNQEGLSKKKLFLSALKTSAICFVVICFILFFIGRFWLGDFEVERIYYNNGEERLVYGVSSQIRIIILEVSLLISAFISAIILFFVYKNRLRKHL